MKITYGDTTLGDDSTGDCISEESGPHTREVQQENLAFAAAPFSAGRGNARNGTTFTVDKVHADEKTAARYWRQHPDSLPGQAQLSWINDDFTDKMADACLVSIERGLRNGKSTLMRYTFTGGPITTV